MAKVKFTVQMEVEAEVQDDGICMDIEVERVTLDNGFFETSDIGQELDDFLQGLAEAQYRNRLMAQKEAKGDDDRE